MLQYPINPETGMIHEYLNPKHASIISKLDYSSQYDLNTPEIVDVNFYDGRCFYQNNKKIKRAGRDWLYTPEMIEEIEKCANDIIYFAERYFYIRTLDHGRIKIPLRDYQKQFLRISDHKELREFIYLAARQSAKSTIMTLRILHKIIFEDDYQVAILANKGGTAMEIFSRVRLAYEELPLWLQRGVVEWNKGSVSLENGSKCFASSTSSDAVRGFSLNEVLCLTGENLVTIRNDETGEIKTMPISEVQNFCDSYNQTALFAL